MTAFEFYISLTNQMPTSSHNKRHVFHLDKKAVKGNSHNCTHQGYTRCKANLAGCGWALWTRTVMRTWFSKWQLECSVPRHRVPSIMDSGGVCNVPWMSLVVLGGLLSSLLHAVNEDLFSTGPSTFPLNGRLTGTPTGHCPRFLELLD